ncbi:MAG: ribonuclease HII [Candidatus Saccharimonadales bacterium]
MILGIDEVGRGPWAGPLVIGAVVLGDIPIEGLTDSKKLTKKKRDELDVIIRRDAAGFGLGWVSSEEIDKIGLSAALRLATIRAVEQVKAPYHEIIIDGTINFLSETSKGKYVTTLPKGDLLIPSISAASIIAKVARDTYMAEQDEVYPGYNFTSHVGYGTAAHKQAIETLGVTPLHRTTFAPIAAFISDKPSTKQIGDAAETVVAQYLIANGHAILDRNWKTKYCEIDIISLKKGTIYFTEVKYRHNSVHGDGLSAITPKKHKQMAFAAELYITRHPNREVRLIVASLSGDTHLDEFLELE